MPVPFLPQARPTVPQSADLTNPLLRLGDTVSEGITKARERNELSDLGQAAQGGLDALRDEAFRQGRIGVGLQAQGALDQRADRAASRALQERRIDIAEQGLRIKQEASQRDAALAQYFMGRLQQGAERGETLPDVVGQAQVPSAVRDAAMAAFAVGDVVEGAKILADSEQKSPQFQREVEAAKAQGREEGKRTAQLPQLFSKAKAANDQIKESRRLVVQDIERSIDLANSFQVTGIFSLAKAVPGTPAADLFQLLQSIKANVGFDKLQNMRENSPTGGALGQVSNLEIGLLQSVFGSLEQSQTREQFLFNMRRLKDTLGRLSQAREEAFRNDFGDLAGPQGAPASTVRRRYNPNTGALE